MPPESLSTESVAAPGQAGQVEAAVHRLANVLDPVEPREHRQVVDGHVDVEVVELQHDAHLARASFARPAARSRARGASPRRRWPGR